MTGLLLSDILRTAPKFSFFDELIRVPRGLTDLLQHDFLKINKIVDDIGLYLRELQVILQQIKDSQVEMAVDLDWYFEGRAQVFELFRNMDSIDSIISRLLIVVDSPQNAKQVQFNHLLTKFEETSDLLLDVKKLFIVLKKKIDVAINYREINDMTISSLNSEIETCLKSYFKLQDMKLTSPNRTFPNFNLQDIISKMKLNSMSINNFSMNSINLPTFNSQDELVYTQFSELHDKLSPLKVSIDFLPLRIDEFNSMNSNIFPRASVEVNKNYEELRTKWEYLNELIRNFQSQVIDTKWNEIFDYLLNHVVSIVDALVEEFDHNSNRKITKKIGEHYKLCSNSITIVRKAVTERILSLGSTVCFFNENLLPKWNHLNEILSLNQRIDDISNYTSNEFAGLRSFQTVRNTSPIKQSSPRKQSSPVRILSSLSPHNGQEPAGLGIDLGLGVEDTDIPISIRNAHKIKDFQQDFDIGKSSKPNLLPQFNLSHSIEEEQEEDLKPEANKELDEIMNGFKTIALSKTTTKKKNTKSKIPVIKPNYIQSGYPIIKKIYLQSRQLSRIPSIAPTHPVFSSPQLSPIMKRNLDSPITFKKLRSNSVNVNRSPTPRSELGYKDDVFRRPSATRSGRSERSSRASSLNFTSPLNLGNTPNLLYPQSSPSYNSPPSHRSTSPERPTSSMGSRFDDEHLMQPLKNIKPSWK